MNEVDVILRVHQALLSHLLGGGPVARLYTDAHSTLLPHAVLRPFQRFVLDFGDFVMHPDLVGQLDDGETVFAVEAKGENDLLRGLAQAEMYLSGFHLSFFAADATSLGTSLLQAAARKNIGVIAVSDTITVVNAPVPSMPLRAIYRSIESQLDSTIQVSTDQSFIFNIPTHYLVWAIAFERERTYLGDEALATIQDYPLPKDWRGTLQGARKLGIVRVFGNEVSLTPVGAAVKELLPPSTMDWASIHNVVGARGTAIPLADYRPQYAAVLRLLLLQDPFVRLLIQGLDTCRGRSANFRELAMACDRLDHARTLVFFLQPEALPVLLDHKGRIRWQQAVGEHFRSRTFYQYKSVLKHAGILQPGRLGGASTIGYQPENDIWTLR